MAGYRDELERLNFSAEEKEALTCRLLERRRPSHLPGCPQPSGSCSASPARNRQKTWGLYR